MRFWAGRLLPRVENPIPDTIGLGTIVTAAGAGGVLGVVAAALLGEPPNRWDAWGRRGLVIGFICGACFYLAALIGGLS